MDPEQAAPTQLQAPATQAMPGAQAFAHCPQFAASELVSTQASAQRVPALHGAPPVCESPLLGNRAPPSEGDSLLQPVADATSASKHPLRSRNGTVAANERNVSRMG
jgi:hypothetical protein